MFTQIAGAMACAQNSKLREKMFGEGRAVPLDRNAKARIAAYARALSHRCRSCATYDADDNARGRHDHHSHSGVRPGC